MSTTPDLAVVAHRTTDPLVVVEQARAAEAAGFDEFWVIEDCGYTAGVSLAAAVLTATDRIGVGLGIVPAVVRNPMFTAMEFATLARLGPGRFHGGIGHGVPEWMAPIGAAVASPLGALGEVTDAVRRLLAGETVTVEGSYVRLDDARLHEAPLPCPPVSIGAHGPRSLELSGRIADGTVLAEFVGPTFLRAAREHIAAGAADGGGDSAAHRVTVFAAAAVDADGDAARRGLAPFLAGVASHGSRALAGTPFWGELSADADRHGWADAVERMPTEWWAEIAAVGTAADAADYVARMGDAGADCVALFPDPDDPVADTIALADALVLAV